MYKQVRLLWILLPFNRIRFWPCLACLILIIIFLQVLHNALLSRLEEKEARIKENMSSFGRHLQGGRMLNTVISEMEERVRNAHRFDRSGTYFVLDNFLTSEHVILGRNKYESSIATHSSLAQLHHLVELTERWNGPISVSVFTFGNELISTISSLIHYHFCNDHIYRYVSFHLVYPIRQSEAHNNTFSDLKLICTQHNFEVKAKISQDSNSEIYSNVDLEYPINLLRNMAINYVQTPYLFTIDIDFVPSENLRFGFQKFMSLNSHLVNKESDTGSEQYLNGRQSLSAFVVPDFEISDSVEVPRHKQDLLKLWINGTVRPFGFDQCVQCQSRTNFNLWKVLNKSDEVRIGYSVQRDGIWDPFYIAKSSLPLYDERFKQFGYSSTSQVCEMHVAGFKFHVLDNAFIVHKGFKVKDDLRANKVAEKEKNKQLFVKFKEELLVKYPQEDRRC